jgi:hypothetical protein
MSAIAAHEGDSVDGRIIPECIQAGGSEPAPSPSVKPTTIEPVSVEGPTIEPTTVEPTTEAKPTMEAKEAKARSESTMEAKPTTEAKATTEADRGKAVIARVRDTEGAPAG